MCMMKPNYSMPESTPTPTPTPVPVPVPTTTTVDLSTNFISHDLEKQQPFQPHEEKQPSVRSPSLYKILISLNLLSVLILGVLYYFIELHPNISTNLNELFHKMEKCNDL